MAAACTCYRYSWNPPQGFSRVDHRNFDTENDAKTFAMQARKYEFCTKVEVEVHEGMPHKHYAVLIFFKYPEVENLESSKWDILYDDREYDRRRQKKERRRTLARKAKNRARHPTAPFVLEFDEVDIALAILEAPRKRHLRGWKDSYVPTRNRYWRSQGNNWKKHRTHQYR